MYVVTGATGHVGSVVAEQLLSQGNEVRAIVRDRNKAAALAGRGAELAVGSLQDVDFMVGALGGADGAFLLTPPNFTAPDFRTYQASMAGSLANAVKRSGVPHVVLLSSLGADVASGNGPIQGAHRLEAAMGETGARVTALRPGMFQENVLATLELARGKGIYPSFIPDGIPSPMIATRDIGVAAARALLSPPAKSEAVDLQGPSYAASEVAETLGRVIGRELQLVVIPPEQHRGALIEAGFPQQIAEIFAEMYGFFLRGGARPVGDRAVQVHTPLEETLRAAFAATA